MPQLTKYTDIYLFLMRYFSATRGARVQKIRHPRNYNLCNPNPKIQLRLKPSISSISCCADFSVLFTPFPCKFRVYLPTTHIYLYYPYIYIFYYVIIDIGIQHMDYLLIYYNFRYKNRLNYIRLYLMEIIDTYINNINNNKYIEFRFIQSSFSNNNNASE